MIFLVIIFLSTVLCYVLNNLFDVNVRYVFMLFNIIIVTVITCFYFSDHYVNT